MYLYYTIMRKSLFIVCATLLCASCRGPDIRLYDNFVRVLDTTTFSTATVIEKLREPEAGLAGLLADNIPLRNIKVESILYKTYLPNGDRAFASGIIARPVDIPVIGVVSALHATMAQKYQAPSEAMFCRDILPAFLGYVVFVSDYIGLGQTVKVPQPYLHLESTARCQIDMVIAGREYLKYEYGLDTYGPMYVEGYSQGGALALNFMRVTQRDYPDTFKIKKVFCGGAPMDLPTIIEEAVRTNNSELPIGIALVVEGLNYAENLGLDYNRLFTGELLERFDLLVRSKRFTAQEICDQLGTTVSTDFLHPDFFTEEGNDQIDRLLESGRRNSLTSCTDWAPDPEVPILMLHSYTDEAVAYANIEKGVAFLRHAGANLEFVPTVGSHAAAGMTMYLAFWNELRQNE